MGSLGEEPFFFFIDLMYISLIQDSENTIMFCSFALNLVWVNVNYVVIYNNPLYFLSLCFCTSLSQSGQKKSKIQHIATEIMSSESV